MMLGIENLAIFVAATVSTLLGFVAVVFIFWASVAGRYAGDKLKQNKSMVNTFRCLVVSAILIIVICFVTLYNAIADQNGDCQPIFLMILTVGFIIFIVFVSLFFVKIVDDLMGTKK